MFKKISVLLALVTMLSAAFFLKSPFASECTFPNNVVGQYGAKFLPAPEMFQNIKKFVVYLDYGLTKGADMYKLECIKNKSISECARPIGLGDVTEAELKINEVYLSKLVKKYTRPYGDKVEFGEMVRSGIKRAYSECIDSPEILFVDHLYDKNLDHPDNLIIHIYFPFISGSYKRSYTPLFLISLHRKDFNKLADHKLSEARIYLYEELDWRDSESKIVQLSKAFKRPK